jgi:hypothetical protein
VIWNGGRCRSGRRAQNQIRTTDRRLNSPPYTELTRRYVDLKALSSAERLKKAESTDPGELAREFAQSVSAFQGFSTDQPFFPENPDRDLNKSPEAASRGYGWAMAIKRQQLVEVERDPELNFRYVEREIVPTRTQRRTQFEDPDGHEVQIDIILANDAGDAGRPIVTELKIARDKDPFTALIQALAGAAQLASSQQRARLSSLGDSVGVHLASHEEDPLLDVYVLLGAFPKTGRDLFDQLKLAGRLARHLEQEDEVRAHLGRIRVLAATRTPDDHLRATTELPAPASP